MYLSPSVARATSALLVGARYLQSRRDCIFQPRVASLRATLGFHEPVPSALQGLYPRGPNTCDVVYLERHAAIPCNPFRVGAAGRHSRSQGSRCATTAGLKAPIPLGSQTGATFQRQHCLPVSESLRASRSTGRHTLALRRHRKIIIAPCVAARHGEHLRDAKRRTPRQPRHWRPSAESPVQG